HLASSGSLGLLNPRLFLLGLAAVFTAVAGSNALNCYLERELDTLMTRTRRRPLPRGAVRPRDALILSLSLLLAAPLLALLPTPGASYPLLLYLAGVSIYILLYTLLLKRRSRLNILAVAPSAATPVWYGWMLGGAPFDLRPLLLGLISSLWTLPHLWSLAYAYARDYRRGGVPMLPAVSRGAVAVRVILLSLIALLASSLALIPLSNSPIYPASALSLCLLLSYLALRFYLEPSGRRAWRLFKATSPYILLLLASYALDQSWERLLG
ncbi:MAG: protoheme IX farnesyltransferase, partial [Candidatus Bathyarchaeota archaeon B23]